jgi:enoyl-CoA hydratase/carnithine racemase
VAKVEEVDVFQERPLEVDVIQYEVSNHVAYIWLNRPHKRNCVSAQLMKELGEAIDRAGADPDVRVMVLRGRGNTFCSGYDLDELQAEYLSRSAAIEVAHASAHFCDKIFNARKPSVAVLEGYTTAGGFEIMINCDFAIAADDALIGDFHIRRALFGGAGPIYRLPRIVGLRKAKELMLTGKLISGRQAYEWGLVNDCAPAEELDATVDRFVADLVDKSPFQMGITKMAINRGLDADVDTLMLVERLAVGVTLNSNDAAEGVAAFLDKRDPTWTGT